MIRYYAFFVIIMLITKVARANEYDFNKACDFNQEHTSIFYLSKSLSAREWLDILDNKGKFVNEEGFGAYRVYENRGFQLVYFAQSKNKIITWQAVWDKSRIPEYLKTKTSVIEMFGVKNNVGDVLELGCDCGSANYYFSGNKTTRLEIDFSSCN